MKFLSTIKRGEQKNPWMNEKKKKKKIVSSTVSAELFAAKPRSVLLGHSSPSLSHTLLEVFLFFLFSTVWRCVETPGHGSGRRGAAYLIPALARP